MLADASAFLPSSRLRITQGRLVFAIALSCYLAAAVVLLRHGVEYGDAVSRVFNAHSVVLSRDPHLAAIGFVWNPLPALAMVPLVLLRPAFPFLTQHGAAANIVSALAMAGAVGALWSLLRVLGAQLPVRIAVTLGFALHPLILVFGGNGMSEGPMLLFLLLTARSLVRWSQSQRHGDLVGAGVWLGLAYLTRYEVGAVAAVLVPLVLLRSYRVTAGNRERRAWTAVTDMALFFLPFLFAFVAWAAIAWVIVGTPFPHLTSQYGNAAQVHMLDDVIRAQTDNRSPRFLLRQLLGVAPLAPAALALGLLAARRRVHDYVFPVAIFVAVLAFQAAGFVAGLTFGVLRFSIAAVPLQAVAIAVFTSPRGRFGRTRWAAPVGAIAAVAVLLPAFPAAARTMLDRRLAPEEASVLRAGFFPQRASEADRNFAERPASWRRIARAIDDRHLPNGSVATDAAYASGVILGSTRPKQFVTTPDRDFQQIVAGFRFFPRVRYALLQDPKLYPNDELNRQHPRLYTDGIWDGGRATLEEEFDLAGGVWRLYRLTKTTR